MAIKNNSCKFAAQCVLAGSFLVITSAAFAADISLVGDDGFGTSSFNSGLNWDGGAAPSAGNNYFTGDFRVRTPADGDSHTFAGDALTVNNTNGYSWGLMYKGAGDTGTITVDNLILDGGMISHANGIGDVFNLDGGVNVASDSTIYAKQGPIYVYSDISGSAQIHNQEPDNNIECKLWIGSAANTYTGNIVNNGRLGLLPGANLNFVIGASGVNNSITSPGGQKHVTLDGDLVFDLSGASTTEGDSWAVIDTTPESTYYGSTFNVVGFTPLGDDITWRKEISPDLFYSFSEETGVLNVIPEPASIMVLVLGGLLLRRR